MKNIVYLLFSFLFFLSCSNEDETNVLEYTKWRAQKGDSSYQLFFGSSSGYYGEYVNGITTYNNFDYHIEGSNIILIPTTDWSEEIKIKIQDSDHLVLENLTYTYKLTYDKVKY